MGEGSGEIVVKGGSVHVIFDNSLYLRDSNDPSAHKHEGRKITRIRVQDEKGQSVFDSDVNKDGLNWTITVSTQG